MPDQCTVAIDGTSRGNIKPDGVKKLEGIQAFRRANTCEMHKWIDGLVILKMQCVRSRRRMRLGRKTGTTFTGSIGSSAPSSSSGSQGGDASYHLADTKMSTSACVRWGKRRGRVGLTSCRPLVRVDHYPGVSFCLA